MWAGEAVAKKRARTPYQRHAAHSMSSSIEAGGPIPSEERSGLSVRDRGSSVPSPMIQPRTERPCSSTRTLDPGSVGPSNPSGTR